MHFLKMFHVLKGGNISEPSLLPNSLNKLTPPPVFSYGADNLQQVVSKINCILESSQQATKILPNVLIKVKIVAIENLCTTYERNETKKILVHDIFDKVHIIQKIVNENTVKNQ